MDMTEPAKLSFNDAQPIDLDGARKRLADRAAELDALEPQFHALDKRRGELMREIEALKAAIVGAVMARG